MHFRRHVESGRFMFLYLIVASSCRLMAVFAPVANVPPHPGDLQWGARSLLILASTDRASSPFSGLRKSSAATTSSTSLDGQINQDPAKQHRQFCKQVQVGPVSCHLHPPLWLGNKKDPCFRNRVPEETSPHLQPGAQDQCTITFMRT